MIFDGKKFCLKFTRFFEGLRMPPPFYSQFSRRGRTWEICISDQLSLSFACSPAEIQLKDIPSRMQKLYILVVHASKLYPHSGSKGQKFMNILCASCLYEFQIFLPWLRVFFLVLMRTFSGSSSSSHALCGSACKDAFPVLARNTNRCDERVLK